NTALTEMTGATSPQLHLELLCARILLPSSEDTTRGVTARVDRLERRLSIGRGAAAAGPDETAASPAASSPAASSSAPTAPVGPGAPPGGRSHSQPASQSAPAPERPA